VLRFSDHPRLSRPLTRPPDSGRVSIQRATVQFRAAPRDRGDWLRRIDRRVAYANSIVEN